MAIRGRGKGLEPRIPTKPAAPVKQAVAPVPEIDLYTMPPQQLPQAVIAPPKGQPIQIPVGVAPVVAPPVAVAPPPPPVAPAPAPVPIPQIDPAVLAQIQEQFNIPAPAPVKPAPAPAPVKEVAPPPPPRRIEEPPKAPVAPPAPPVKVPLPPVQDTAPVMPPPLPTPVNPPKVIPGESGPIIANPNEPIAPPPVQVPPPVVQPAPPPPPPPAAVAPPPPPIPQISPEVLAQIQQEFNIPAAPPAPPVAPPVQVPPPVMQPAPPPPAAVAPPPPPVQVPPPTFVDEFEEPLAMDGMRGGPRSGIGSLPEAPPEAVVPPPVQVPPPVVQAEPVAPPVTPTVDPSLYSDPELGVEPGFGGTRGVSPMSPRELMGSNYIEPRDGPGQVPPGQTVDISEPTGIETMAGSVGQGDYLDDVAGDTSDTISLPDGSTFDLSTLDLSGIDIGGFGGMSGGFDLNNVNVGGVDPSLYSDPELGGGTRGEPLPDTRGGGPGFDPFAGVTGGLGPGGYGPEGGGFSPETEPAFNHHKAR